MSDKSPTVYIVQDNGRSNFVKAAAFGGLVTLLPAKMQIQLDSTEVSDHLRDKLENYTANDYILATGDPAAIVLACAWAAYWSGTAGVINLLKYDRQTDSYYKLKMELP